MSDFITLSLFASMLHLSIPVILPMLGGLLCERSGVVNIGLEGMMLGGAFGGVAFSYLTGNPWLGLAGAMSTGALAGGLLAVMSVSLRGDQVIGSTAINLIGAGLTAALVPIIWGIDGTTPSVPKVPTPPLPLVGDLPLIGPLLAEFSLIDIIAFGLVFLVWWVLMRTDMGLRLRACGESAVAADAAGIDVTRVRFIAVTLSGVLAALGGAYLSIVTLDLFQASMTQGRGFLALAAMVFGKWRVGPAFLVCLGFGLADAVALRAQIFTDDLPHDLLFALPYVLALVALATFVGRASGPADVGKPFRRA
ncbi:ABC transporter permease [Celeribacter neptunius]|uniref:Simple sugar transport system permease protein n=1 Tax=Celeribacter neptunius TaxID=588602 RepID=A0A1I3VT08_9RHOB|nr:ABC transporter permease [Celeribacter neptunius]SFJ97427.1 simple sugar transport system permease protein [Celeribacter neptunius]